jgi:hypothetical protein
MSDIPLRKRSAVEIVDAAFQVYRRHALTLIMVTALAYTPWLVINLLFIRALADPTAVQGAGFVIRSLIIALGAVITIMLMSGVLTKLGAQAYLSGETGRVEDAIREVLPRVPGLIGAGILRSLLVGLGLVLLFIPGVIFFLTYVAITPVIVIEGKGVSEAFSRSSQLTRNQKMHVLGTYALLMLLYFLLLGGLTAVSALLTSISLVFQQLLSTVFIILFFPIFGLAEMLLYYDLRVRNEGYDVEVMAGSLGEHPSVG